MVAHSTNNCKEETLRRMINMLLLLEGEMSRGLKTASCVCNNNTLDDCCWGVGANLLGLLMCWQTKFATREGRSTKILNFFNDSLIALLRP